MKVKLKMVWTTPQNKTDEHKFWHSFLKNYGCTWCGYGCIDCPKGVATCKCKAPALKEDTEEK